MMTTQVITLPTQIPDTKCASTHLASHTLVGIFTRIWSQCRKKQKLNDFEGFHSIPSSSAMAMDLLLITDLPATIACSSSSRFLIQRRKQLIPCIKEKTPSSWLHYFWGENCMRTKTALSDSLNNRILCETSWTHDWEVHLQPGIHLLRSYVTLLQHFSKACLWMHLLNTGPGGNSHFHNKEAKDLDKLHIC